MKYAAYQQSKKKKQRGFPRRLLIVLLVGLAVVLAATITARQVYYQNLQPVDSESQQTQEFTVELGATADEIASQLESAGLIRSAWAFKLYVSSKQARSDLQAGTYSLSPAQNVNSIVSQLTHGEVTTDLITILPGQRLAQVREGLINNGFSEAEVDQALEPGAYGDHPALVDKPKDASLEGYIYPETFQKTDSTTAQDVIRRSLDEMNKQLTPHLRNAYAQRGLSTFEGIILASIVEREAANAEDRTQVAQVYLKRLKEGMRLEADPTAHYGAHLAGAELTVRFPSAYNTYMHEGLPPGPISNVSAGSLQAVAQPADTDWLYFVAGDDGQTHFSKTLEEHELNTERYCTELCR